LIAANRDLIKIVVEDNVRYDIDQPLSHGKMKKRKIGHAVFHDFLL